VCSDHQARLARIHGVEPVVIPLGVDAGRFDLRGAGHGSGDRPASEKDARWRVIHVASLNRVKDQTTLLEAFARIDRAHLDIVGEDTLGGSVQDLARQRGLAARVTFHGFQPTDVIARLYRRADLFVLSSRHEAANVAVLEAAASGLATVGTHVGYLADWSPDRAVTVPVGDATALARAIKDLLEDPDRRRRIAAAAREWTLAHDADWSAAAFERLYRELSAGALERANAPLAR
jgi:glycosyltransferase involved in cell wall biosynthesis